MNRPAAISFAIVLAAATVSAQSVNQYHPQKFDPEAQQSGAKVILELHESAPSACPVALRATQNGMDNRLVKVSPGQPETTPPSSSSSQSIHLSAARGSHGAIVQATVKVHGLSNKARMVPLASQSGPSDIARRMNVAFDRSDTGEAADLILRGFTAVSFVDIESVTYADGSTWTANATANGTTCRIIPDPMMLIGAR